VAGDGPRDAPISSGERPAARRPRYLDIRIGRSIPGAVIRPGIGRHQEIPCTNVWGRHREHTASNAWSHPAPSGPGERFFNRLRMISLAIAFKILSRAAGELEAKGIRASSPCSFVDHLSNERPP